MRKKNLLIKNRNNKKKILFLVNSIDFFISHRLPIARRCIQEDYSVIVAAPKNKEFIKNQTKYNFQLIDFDIKRKNTNFLQEILVVFKLFFLLIRIKPNLVHLITIKPVLYGGLVAKFFKNIKFIASITGLGSSFIDKDKNKTTFYIIKFLYKTLVSNKNLKIIFQNNDDIKLINKFAKINEKNIVLIKGSGFDKTIFNYNPEIKQKPIVCFASRLLIHKGVNEYIDAIKILRNKNFNHEFILAGDIDYDNPTAINQETILKWENDGLINFLGHIKNMPELLKKINIFVLPSYREGFPKVLLEVSSIGRAIVTTDVPGCKEIVIHNKTGLLVPMKDSVKLSEAIQKLLLDSTYRYNLGKNGSIFVNKHFSLDKIIQQHINLYLSM